MSRPSRTGAWSVFIVAIMAATRLCEAATLPPSRHSVDLYRDEYGMAHLYAAREEDGFYGLGYAIGEDRLLQVLTWYVAVRGELAATFGTRVPPPYPAVPPGHPTYSVPSFFTDPIGSDRNVRQYQILASARRNFKKLPAQLQRDLSSYIAGLRAYMEAHPQQTPAWAPPLEPAMPLAMFHFMVMEPEGVCAQRKKQDAANAPVPLGGSNAWAVARSRTADGSVILESDSHSPIETFGTLFYPYRIKAGELDFMAFDPAGAVLFFFGHSAHFAWGVTEAPRFVADCYRIATEPNALRRYRYDGAMRRIEAAAYRIRVKGGADESGEFEYTHHNGVLSPIQLREPGVAYAVSYASIDRVGLATAQYYRMAKARSFAQLEQALALRDAYPANLIIAGADGTIMYIRPGRIPIRPAGVDVTRALDGNTAATAWRGFHSYAEALKLINPPQGYVGNCNVSPDAMYPTKLLRPEDYPRYYAFRPGDTNARQQRLLELLGTAQPITLQGAQSIAMDETVPPARAWGVVFAKLPSADQPAELRDFLALLARFDGNFNKESRAAYGYSETRRALLQRDAAEAAVIRDSVAAGRELTQAQQTLVLEAAAVAAATVVHATGRIDPMWGEIHRVGRGGVDLPIGGVRMELGSATGVPESSLRALNFRPEGNSAQQWLFGGQRVPFVVHFGTDSVQSYAQTLLGVSDNPASPHFSDQAALASNKVLRRIPLTRGELESAHASRIRLSPLTRAAVSGR